MVLRDISESTGLVRDYPGKSLASSVEDYLRTASDPKSRPNEDLIGVISFQESALIDAVPSERLTLDARAIRAAGRGTDVASAIQLALATLRRDAMHRLLLIWDGNQTTGDLETALAAAAAQRVPIDVMPLKYDVKSEVLVDRFIAPTWKRENEPFTIEIILRSTNALPTTGRLTVTDSDRPMDLDPATDGVQTTRLVTLQPGRNVERVTVPPLASGVHMFHASFEGENVMVEQPGGAGATTRPGAPRSAPGAAGGLAGDTLLQNNAADAFT